MRAWTRWLPLVAALALAFVAVSSVVLAVGQRSWGPVAEGLWIPAVVVAACWPGACRCCLPRRGRQAG
jgi:hypothetical protein